jgi:hypothetical protein
MPVATMMVFFAFLSTHIAWRAGQSLIGLPPFERPMFFSRFGPLGNLFITLLVPVAMIATITTLVWAFLKLPWYTPVPLFILAGISFSLIHAGMSKFWPRSYIGFFPALGAVIGTALMLVTQLMLWI